MVLTAVNEGLGTRIVGSFYEKDVKDLLKVPENFEVIALITISYPKEKIDLTGKLLRLVCTRKILTEIAREEEYGKPFVPKTELMD